MAVISVFSGTFCNADQIISGLLSATGYQLVSDAELVAQASRLSNLSEANIARVFTGKTSVFNRFTHERERSVAYLRLALAQRLSADNLLFYGFSSHLIPQTISHALRVCLIADTRSRLEVARSQEGLEEKEALKLLHAQDQERGLWVREVRGKEDPWAAELYDIVLPTDKSTPEQAVNLIRDYLNKPLLQPSAQSRQAAADFLLAAEVEVALAKEGHSVGVRAENGEALLTINKHVLLLSRLEEELKAIASKVPGVRRVTVKVGEGFYQADIYRRYDFQTPSKVLLVDDEREFVQTLSERLIMRDMGSAVAYDGESALTMIEEEEPEVMILDLKMPGIDGIEVLRRVKSTRPDIEVIILTGHGSEEDRKQCMALGAFAYLQKPVDIELLSETLRRAYERIRTRQGS